jgi:hypothetical protein
LSALPTPLNAPEAAFSLLREKKKLLKEHRKGAYPRTDNILSRAINLSVGVVDAGLGAAFGINIDSSTEEIRQTAARFREACLDKGTGSLSV